MISCTEFIPSYSELFKYLDEHYGYEEVQRFWTYLSTPDRVAARRRQPKHSSSPLVD